MPDTEVSDNRQPPSMLEGPEFLRSLYEQAAVGIEQVAPDGRLLMANAAFCRMLGYSQSELIGKKFEVTIPPDDRQRESMLLNRILTGKYSCLDIEKRFLHRSGAPVWAAVTSFLVGQGQTAPYCLSIVRNITELRLAKAQFGLVVESAPTAMLLISVDGTIVLANAHAETLFGYRPGELLNQPVEILVPETLRSGHSELRAYFFANAKQRVIGNRSELSGRHKNGTHIPLEISLFPIELDNRRWALASIVDISERKKFENALRESEDRLRLLLDSTAEGIFGIDLEARCTFCNSAGLRILGYESADLLLGKNMHQLIHHTRPDGTPYPPQDCPILKALRHGLGAHIQDEVLWKANGTSFHAEYWSNPQVKGGQVVGAVVAFYDTTRRQRAMRMLEKSEEKFSTAFHESPMAMTLTSVEGHRYIEVNEAFTRISGYTREEVIGLTPFDIGIWVNPAQRLELVQHLLTEGNFRNVEIRFRAKNGFLGYGLASGQLIEVDGEQLILGTVLDITDRKRTLQELQESEEKFRTIFRDAPQGMAMAAPDGRYLAVNKAFCDFLGYTEEELLATNIVSVTHPEDRPATLNRLRSLRDHPDSDRIEKRYLHKGGQVRWGYLSRSLIRDADRTPAFMVSQVVDITERKRVEQELRQREAELIDAQRVAQVGSWTEDPETGTVTWSDELYRIQGRDPNLPPPSFDQLAQLLTAESWERLKDARKKALQTGHVATVDLELIRQNGARRWICVRGEVERDVSGRIVRFRGTAQDITDRKSMEQELYRSASDLNEAQRLAQLGSWTMDPDTGRQTWSDELYSIFGLHPSLPPPSFDEMASLFTASSWERLKIAKRAGNVASLELELIRPDGSRRWIFSQGEAERDGSGRIVRLHGTAQDITERRKAEEALRESEERFRRVVEHVGDALFVDDVDGRVVFANDQFLKLFGFSRDELQNIVLADYVAPEYCAELRGRHERRMRGETMPTHFEYEGLRRDGTRMWLEVDVVAIKDQDGKLIGTQSALRDITSRMQAERAVRESEERFRTIANSAPVMIWMSGTDKLCTYFNKPWLDFSGRSLEAELGNGWTEGIHPDDLATCMESYTQSFDRREPFKIEYRLKRHDGEYRWIVDIGVPRFDTDGSFAGYIGSCADDTERRAGMEALRTVSGRLIQAQEDERKRIARDLHDDINQRLAMLAIDLQRLKNEKRLSDVRLRDKVEELFNQTTDISSEVQAISHQLHSASLDYLGLAAGIQGLCEDLARHQKVSVDFVHSGVPASLPAEVTLALFRVAQEALHNAVKYSGTKKFTVRLLGTPGQIELTVRDSGVGFGPEAAMHGRGLGLISMRERIVPLKGTISIVSKPQHGTEIMVRVPVAASK